MMLYSPLTSIRSSASRWTVPQTCQGKQVINVLACGPKSFFLEHFMMARPICWRSCWPVSCTYSNWFANRLLVLCYQRTSECLMTTTLKWWSNKKNDRFAPKMNTSFIPWCFFFATIPRTSWSSYARSAWRRRTSRSLMAVCPMQSTIFAWILSRTSLEWNMS